MSEIGYARHTDCYPCRPRAGLQLRDYPSRDMSSLEPALHQLLVSLRLGEYVAVIEELGYCFVDDLALMSPEEAEDFVQVRAPP